MLFSAVVALQNAHDNIPEQPYSGIDTNHLKIIVAYPRLKVGRVLDLTNLLPHRLLPGPRTATRTPTNAAAIQALSETPHGLDAEGNTGK
jgi:hypothetical protein